MNLKQRGAAGLLTRYRAARADWYFYRLAARHIKYARRYGTPGAPKTWHGGAPTGPLLWAVVDSRRAG